MKSKDETLSFMQSWKDNFKKKSLSDDATICEEINILRTIINTATTVAEAYNEYGRGASDMQTEFKSIFYREDCYDYLLEKGFNHAEAFELSELIRKGRYSHYNPSIIHQNIVGVDFYEWAKGVRYLPSRQRIFDKLV